MITLQKLSVIGKEDVFLVTIKNQKLGLISKFKPRKGEWHPWKAFKLDGAAKHQPNTMIDVFYGRGGKKAAIEAVLKAAAETEYLAAFGEPLPSLSKI